MNYNYIYSNHLSVWPQTMENMSNPKIPNYENPNHLSIYIIVRKLVFENWFRFRIIHSFSFLDYLYFPLFGVTRGGHSSFVNIQEWASGLRGFGASAPKPQCCVSAAQYVWPVHWDLCLRAQSWAAACAILLVRTLRNQTDNNEWISSIFIPMTSVCDPKQWKIWVIQTSQIMKIPIIYLYIWL